MLPLKRQYRREGFTIAKDYLNTEILGPIKDAVILFSQEGRADRSETIMNVGADNSCLNYDLRLAPSKLTGFALSDPLTSLVRFVTEWDQAF